MERIRSKTLKLFVVQVTGVEAHSLPFFHTIRTIVAIFLAKVSRDHASQYLLALKARGTDTYLSGNFVNTGPILYGASSKRNAGARGCQ
jgi:hypothetical protein